MSAPQKISVLEHLRELRNRFIKSLIALVVGTGVASVFTFRILEFLKGPAGDTPLIQTAPTEFIATYFKVALIGGLILAMPVVLYQFMMFAAPGLTPREKRYVLVSLPGIVLLFAAGVVFAWFVLVPPAIHFFFTFGSSGTLSPPGWLPSALHFLCNFGGDVVEPFIRIDRYINFILMFTLWVGLSFQTPLVMSLLARLGVVKPASFAKRRKLAVVCAFIAAAILTPTVDPFIQTALASPIIVLYEMGIWLSKLANSRRLKAAERRMLELEQ